MRDPQGGPRQSSTTDAGQQGGIPIIDTSFKNVTSSDQAMDRALEQGSGIVRLAPTWVPRVFSTPGRRLRLHPDDYFPFGAGRGGIDERWLASAIRADNGPNPGPFEGLSLVVAPEGALLPFDEFVEHHGTDLIGERIWNKYAGWPSFAKFFDNQQALPFHIHHRDRDAQLIGKRGKPEAYFYPPQMNSHLGMHPISFLGLRPGTDREEFAEKLIAFDHGGNNHITDLSLGYLPQLGTGWDIPAGVLHAPASLCTYEPQAASDVLCMCESWSNNREVPSELLWKDVPHEKRGDTSFILDLIDWPANTDPEFGTTRFMKPLPITNTPGYEEQWIVYRSESFSAKQLVVPPLTTVTVRDTEAYGTVIIQGHGRIGVFVTAAIGQLRFGQLSHDEFFVSSAAARAGVKVTNEHPSEPLVMLKHFGPSSSEPRTLF